MNESKLNELRDRLMNVDSLADLTELSQAVRLTFDEIQVDNATQLMYDIIDRMIECDSTEEEILKNAFMLGLIPWCIPTDEGLVASKPYSLHRYQFQERLARWLNRLGFYERFEIRNHVLEFLEKLLKSAPSADQLYVVGAIGFRSQSMYSILWDIVEGRGDLADEALSTCVGLGPTPEYKHEILNRVQAHLNQGEATKGCTLAIRELVGPSRMELAIQLLKVAKENYPDRNSWEYHACLGASTKAVSRCPESDQAHSRIWELLREDPFVVEFTREFAYRCNTQAVLFDLARFITEVQIDPSNEIRVYRLFDRFFQVTKPAQLSGWSKISTNEFKQVVRSYAVKDTKISGVYGTLERSTKRQAWECLIGTENLIHESVILEGIAEESNGYVAHEIAELASSAPIEEIPSSVLSRIQSAEVDREDDENFLRRKGFVSIITACGTRSCFDSMTNFAVTRNGQVLRSTVDSLLGLAKFRQRIGDTDIKEKVWQMTRPEKPKHQREAGTAVFCRLIQEFSEEDAVRLWQLSVAEGMEEFSRSEALQAIGNIKAPLDEDSKSILKTYILDEPGDLGWRACEVLMGIKPLEFTNDNDILDRLNLLVENERLNFREFRSLTSWQAFLIGKLFRHAPERFQPLICEIIDSSSEKCLYQVIFPLRDLGEDCPQQVISSLTSRVQRENSQFMTDTSLISLLGTVSPVSVVEKLKQASVVDWMVEARAAVCDSLLEIATKKPNCREPAILSILEFVFDASFAVRRSAFRALSSLNPERLFDLCLEWKEAPNIEFRKRAAQATEWLPLCEFPDEKIVQLGFTWDVESSVREVARSVLENRWRRHWAELYTQSVIDAASSGISEVIFDARKYGHGIVSFGDDETIRRLGSLLQSFTLYPYVRNWILHLVKETTKQWKKTIESFPEPWYHESGLIEQVKGFIALDGIEIEADLTLWCRHRTNQSDLGEWGCTAFADIPPSKVFGDTKILKLRLPNRRAATARVFATNFSSSGTKLTLFGQGEYPTKSD